MADYLLQEIVPLLSIEPRHIEGAVTTGFDEERYLGPLSVCSFWNEVSMRFSDGDPEESFESGQVVYPDSVGSSIPDHAEMARFSSFTGSIGVRAPTF